MPCKWIVCAKKGYWSKHDQAYEEIEVSVVHSSDKHGRQSYGWESPTKIIINMGNELNKEAFAAAVRIAHVVADHLNSK